MNFKRVPRFFSSKKHTNRNIKETITVPHFLSALRITSLSKVVRHVTMAMMKGLKNACGNIFKFRERSSKFRFRDEVKQNSCRRRKSKTFAA